uniref:Uncharacterized protein n=1 Tax=Lepeophtheirus salmonis TaxID=72036 RepID=A0A0K2SXA1_LEPSM
MKRYDSLAALIQNILQIVKVTNHVDLSFFLHAQNA